MALLFKAQRGFPAQTKWGMTGPLNRGSNPSPYGSVKRYPGVAFPFGLCPCRGQTAVQLAIPKPGIGRILSFQHDVGLPVA